KLLSGFIQEQSKKGGEVVILSEHQNQSDRLEELLGDASEAFNYRILVQNLHGGFLLHDANLSVLTDHEIFGRYHRPVVRRKRVSGGLSLKELKDLQTGDFVVHVDHGIAKFRGFKKIKVRDHIQEAAVLEYREQSILYVNVSSLHKLQKYSGKEGTQPTVTKLGSGEWARKKAAAKKKVKDIARDLIRLYAKRKAETAFSFPPDHPWQTELEARFEYEETKDQFEAIRKVKEDMESPNPMDRLVCGDVGFGKTEVAVRAAFKAVMGQKQVAVLVPTTILADQHAKTFRRRMESFPVVIESLSRFRTAAEQKQVLSDLKEGKVDIVIGTHRLVSKDVQFKDLGLLIIDEEQRFGVSVKEKLKQMRSTVDVLTMTATPIPRTLQFSLMGARDLSVIQTPPANRQPVLTEIHTFNQKIIRDAILFELSRGGQIFFIHNRVSQIEEMAAMLSSLVPNVRVRWAHGQMASAELENIISDFYLHKFDLLVSTNIVENGIDISNANTIMIHHADRFGLSELHQLRGRVGRSMRKAFCYLLTRDWNTLSSDSKKRLTSLEEYSELGSGFSIAMRDLDIRGAGDILGAEQSGFVADIGFTLYTKILDDAVNELKESEF
ncbi:MAG: transcription-repair coupling factor, partial [Balneolaceae bacterium]